MQTTTQTAGDIKVGDVVEFSARCPMVVTSIEPAYIGEPDPYAHLAAQYGQALTFRGHYEGSPVVTTQHTRRERSAVSGPGSVRA